MADVRNVGIILYDGFEELDAVGPLEVFGVSFHAHKTHGRVDAPCYKPITVAVPGSPGGKQVRAMNGLCVVADFAGDDPLLPALDIVLVPGALDTRELAGNRSVTTWLAGLCERASRVTSVCTGVHLLHAAGVTEGKRVATHFMFEDKIEALGGVTVVRDQRWVVDGSLVTSQGVSAGIDMSLWLVGQLYSPDHARETQKLMQYDPAPPYQLEGKEEAGGAREGSAEEVLKGDNA